MGDHGRSSWLVRCEGEVTGWWTSALSSNWRTVLKRSIFRNWRIIASTPRRCSITGHVVTARLSLDERARRIGLSMPKLPRPSGPKGTKKPKRRRGAGVRHGNRNRPLSAMPDKRPSVIVSPVCPHISRRIRTTTNKTSNRSSVWNNSKKATRTPVGVRVDFFVG